MSEEKYKNENEKLKFKVNYAKGALTIIIDDLIDYSIKTPYSVKEIIESLYNLKIYLGGENEL